MLLSLPKIELKNLDSFLLMDSYHVLQIKIDGVRMESMEIEAVLAAAPGG